MYILNQCPLHIHVFTFHGDILGEAVFCTQGVGVVLRYIITDKCKEVRRPFWGVKLANIFIIVLLYTGPPLITVMWLKGLPCLNINYYYYYYYYYLGPFGSEIFWQIFLGRKTLVGTFFRVDKKRTQHSRFYVKQFIIVSISYFFIRKTGLLAIIF